VGVGVEHLESGDRLLVNGDVRFPMASTYKVPIAVQVMTLVEEGKLSLDQKHVVTEGDLFTTHSAISEFLLPGSELTLRNLLKIMLQYSDNVATDLLLEMAGGSAAVTGRMEGLGLAIRVDRPTWAIISNWLGENWVVEKDPITVGRFAELLAKERSPEGLAAAQRAFNADPRDTATPAAMAELLAKIWRHEILTPTSCELLIDIMYGTMTGPGRLKGMLPPGTRVAHKTGTIGQTANDAGIIELPQGAGHVVTVVYIKESVLPTNEDMEPVIAQIARAVYDFFTFRSATSSAGM
jgi:beta-lactamase class A